MWGSSVQQMKSRLARAGVVSAMAVGAVVAVTSFGAPGGAQSDASTTIENPGLDEAPAMSDDGRFVVFASSPDASRAGSSLILHDRGSIAEDGTVLAATTTPISDSLGAVNPAISGDGCIVTWSVPAVIEDVDPVDPEPIVPDPPVPDPSAPDPSVPDPPVDDPPPGDPPEEGEPDPNSSAELIVTDPNDTDPNETGLDETDAGPVDEPAPATVEFAALQAAPARLVVLDQCSDGRADLALGDDDLSFGPAVPSIDGSVIAVSNGTDVIRFARTGAGRYAETNRFDGGVAGAADLLVDDEVDVSDDGSVVVFSSGADPADTSLMTVYAHVVENGQATTAPVLTSATHASVSGDGALIAVATGSDGSAAALVQRTVSPVAPIDLGPGRRPEISADGNHVVVEEGANLAVISSTGQGDVPFATTQRTLLSTTITPTGSGPVIDRFGTTVVSDRNVDVSAAPAETDITITTVGADASFDAALFDLGSGDVGTALAATVTFSNRGPSSIGVASLAVDGTFAISEDRCGTVIRPGTTCEIDVTFVVERLEDAFGVVTLTPTSFGTPAFTTQVTALGAAPEAATTSTTSTSTPNSTGTTTGGTTTGGTTTGRTTTGRTGTNTTRTTTTTTTTVVPGAGVTASPTTFDFAPTIIDAGRRTGLVEIVNNGLEPITVTGVRFDPAAAGAFQVVETTCSAALLPVGDSCAITLGFAPTEVGPQSVSLIASLDAGTDITVPVSGSGAPAPAVTVVPGVASIGQVVTVAGSGFPTGLTVDVTWLSTVTQVVVDDAGTFALPVVVMSHSPTGPADVFVAGQTDLFADVAGSVLVTDTSDRSSPSIIDGPGFNAGR